MVCLLGIVGATLCGCPFVWQPSKLGNHIGLPLQGYQKISQPKVQIRQIKRRKHSI